MKDLVHLYGQYQDDIDHLDRENISIIKRIKSKIRLTKVYLQKFREKVRDRKFKELKNEIKFFKHYKPQLTGSLCSLKRN